MSLTVSKLGLAAAQFGLDGMNASPRSRSPESESRDILNIAARARKPVLASSAPSPLIESVKQFELGITVEPDSLAAVQAGMNQLLRHPPQPRWQAYEAEAAWDVNARGILNAAGLLPATITSHSENPIPRK